MLAVPRANKDNCSLSFPSGIKASAPSSSTLLFPQLFPTLKPLFHAHSPLPPPRGLVQALRPSFTRQRGELQSCPTSACCALGGNPG